jgi:hypothetical protein
MSDDLKRIPTDPGVFEEMNQRKRELNMQWDGLFTYLLKTEREESEEQVIEAADRLERQAERIEDAAYRLEREQ